MPAILALVVALGLPAVAAAQTAVPPAFLGTWASLGLNPGTPPLGAPPTELPYAVIDKALGNFMLPWAFAYHESLEWNIDDTGQVCKLTGIFRQGHGTGAGGFRFVEAAPGKLYQVWSSIDQRGVQRIALGAQHSRTPRPTWNGESVGRFEGADTFIVDTIGFNDKSWLNSDRWVHTEELHVIERYRLYGGGAYIQLRVFVDDRKALKEPYTYTRYYRRITEPSEGGEAVCNQNPPEDDLWAERRNRLLDEFDARLDALVAKYANEPLPAEIDDNAALLAKWALSAAPPADVRLRTFAGVYEPVRPGTELPGGRKASGDPREIALMPAALQASKARDLNFDPAKHCMVVGPFRMMARDDVRFELLPTASRITMFFEITALGNKRELYLGRTAHPANLTPNFQGDSIARWDGDTLVVDTVGFNDFTWLNDAGAPHSDALRLLERFRLLPGGNVLEYQITAEDSQTLAKPYTYIRYFRRSDSPLQEDFCENR